MSTEASVIGPSTQRLRSPSSAACQMRSL